MAQKKFNTRASNDVQVFYNNFFARYKDFFETTPMGKAVQKFMKDPYSGTMAVVDALWYNADQKTQALAFVALRSKSHASHEIARFLMDKNVLGTPLDYAIDAGHIEILSYLVENSSREKRTSIRDVLKQRKSSPGV